MISNNQKIATMSGSDNGRTDDHVIPQELKIKVPEIKTFEDACNRLGIDPVQSKFSEGEPDEIAYKKLKIVVKALNENFTVDWSNDKQQKFFPWFNMNPPGGFKFNGSVCGFACSPLTGGNTMCFKSRGLADYAAEQFADLYKQWLFQDYAETAITTFENACERLGLDASAVLPDVSKIISLYQVKIIALVKLTVIAEALNKGWQPVWDNKEYKYFPWFDLEANHNLGGSGISLGGIRSVLKLSRSSGGCRVVFKSEEIAKYAADQFLYLYKEILT